MGKTTETEDLNQVIAANLKDLRKTCKMTLDDLAAVSGVSKSMLGQVERGDCGLSVSTLWKIANGLKIPFTSLMKKKQPTAEIVDSHALTPLTNTQDGFRLYPVFPFEDGRDFEIFDLEIDSGTKFESGPHKPGTEEYLLVYQGTLSLTVDQKHYEVSSGHSIRYHGDLPHSYANYANVPVRLYMITRYSQCL